MKARGETTEVAQAVVEMEGEGLDDISIAINKGKGESGE